MEKMELYLVKYMSTGVPESKCNKYSKRYNSYVIIKTCNNKIEDVAERFRLKEEEAMQSANSFGIVTKTVSVKKIPALGVLISKE
jgi:hypothetical protein